MKSIIEISHLSKNFNTIQAVKDISFKVKEGEFFTFLGVNGAGKSTTISIMCGQLDKTAGTVIVNGHDLDKDTQSIKRDIGVVFQNSSLDKSLSVFDNLKYRAALYGITGNAFNTKLRELTALLELDDILNRTFKKLSGGQRRRVDIARALLHDPKILILDEPTTGLDPQTRKLVWNVISMLRREKKLTVFLTTHYMEEVADADYVVILDAGKIVAEGTPIELKNSYTGDYIIIYNTDEEKIKRLNLPYQKIRDAYRIEVENTTAATELLIANRDLFKDYEVIKGKMDDVFLAVTGKNLLGGNE